MATNFGTVESSDLTLDPATSNFAMVSSDDEIAQGVRNTLATFQGEWWLDPSIGIPYFQSIAGQTQPDLNTIRGIFVSAISNSHGIDSISSFETDYTAATRAYEVTFTAITTNGTTISDTVII